MKSIPEIIRRREQDRIIRESEAVDIVGLSRVTIWRMEKDGRFPKRVKIGARSIGWKISHINAWMDSLTSNEEV